MAGCLKDREKVGKGDVEGNRDDVGAWHHDVVDPFAAQAENVAQHRPLLGREARLGIGARLLQRVLEIVADRWRGPDPERNLDTLEEALAMRLMRPAFGRGGTSVVIV